MRYWRGTVVEVEVDHRRVTYVEFVRIVGELNGKIVARDGFWPLARYKVLLPKKNVRELLRTIEEAQRSGAEGQTGAP